ncbi:hypothetical protein AWB81_02993 [Caballeronia arationis]|jgi:hypothetical protein|uniref:DUF2934 domain-containing protein n=1 Tax=Caballeronia arationis TaxID=1777142 RepID=A0A7Z7I6N7_9BURK|nr:DUF2934 domain-containing protein [Caballeronia arationis]SAK69472.1 hypothetical protein AWB81_02993 [Caballeronia arationis]SOE64700.1 Protein of unknown function [Caballeronia arationis]
MNDIESQSLETQIRVRAYHLWEADGRPDGRAEEFWRLAQAEVSVPKKAVKRRTKSAEQPAGASVSAKTVRPRKAAEPKAAPSAAKKPSRPKAKLEAQG